MAKPRRSKDGRWPDVVIERVSAEVREKAKCAEALRRVAAGATQAEAARQLSLHPTTVGAWVKRAEELKEVPEQLKSAAKPLTEAEIAAMRAEIARQALSDGDARTALEAMRDEGRRQRLEAELVESRQLSVLADLSSVPRQERRRELAERAARLGLALPPMPDTVPSTGSGGGGRALPGGAGRGVEPHNRGRGEPPRGELGSLSISHPAPRAAENPYVTPNTAPDPGPDPTPPGDGSRGGADSPGGADGKDGRDGGDGSPSGPDGPVPPPPQPKTG